MKKFVLSIVSLIILAFISGIVMYYLNSPSEVSIGCFIYSGKDVFLSKLFNEVFKESNREKNRSKKHTDQNVYKRDCVNSQQTQNDDLITFINDEKKKKKVLAINLVDRNSAYFLIKKAQNKKIPIVFFNKKPPVYDVKETKNVYYVGTKAEDAAFYQCEILKNSVKNKYTKLDKNNDGTIGYVILKGEPGHQDAELRTKYLKYNLDKLDKLVNTKNYQFKRLKNIAEETAMWKRETGYEKMKEILGKKEITKIDVIFANNDEMALGAIKALKEKGYFIEKDKYIPVIGVDATEDACIAIEEGTLLGTVLNDPITQGKVIFYLSYILGKSETIKESVLENKLIKFLKEDKNYYENYKKIDSELNLKLPKNIESSKEPLKIKEKYNIWVNHKMVIKDNVSNIKDYLNLSK